MTRIMTILGARPQFIKAASVSRAFHETDGIEECIIHTGQHFDAGMSDVFFDELDIPAPNHHLGISGGGHGAMTGAMLQALEPLLESERPDWVLVYGDTNSTLAGALAAAKLHIPVAHVEAGLRSFNRQMPEEQNRIITDHLSDLLFTPTDIATKRLGEEGIPAESILQAGDVMYDAALFHADRAVDCDGILACHDLNPGQYVLATVHRAENTDDPGRLRSIFFALEQVAETMPVILPLHPRTRAALQRDGISPKTIRLIEPLGYMDMVALQSHAAVIATDSGGVQKEAYFHCVPCVTLRDETEWTELIEAGWNSLAGADSHQIKDALLSAKTPEFRPEPYGCGDAALRIAKRMTQ